MAVALSRGKKKSRNSYSRSWSKSEKKSSLPTKGIGSFFRWVSGLVIVGSLLVLMSVAVLYAYRFMTTHEYFAIRDVEISGNLMLSKDEILATAGLVEGANSIALNIADVEDRLASSPWIAEVSVKRLLPDRFAIRVTEREPAFWVLRDGTLYYADVHGNILAPVGPGRFTSLPTLEVGPGGEDLLARMPEVIAAFKGARLPVDISLVSWVRLSAARGVELYLDNPGLRISVAPENLGGNLDRLCQVLADLGRRGELREVGEVRAADGNVWVLKDPESR